MVIGESKRDPNVRRRSQATHTTHTSKKTLATPTAIIAPPGNQTASSLNTPDPYKTVDTALLPRRL